MEYASLIAFAVTSCITPGPNNSMLMASGLNYGTRRSLPHYFGIIIGFPLMILAVGLGIAQVFDLYPSLHTVLKIVGAAYLTYLAYKIATAAPASSRNRTASATASAATRSCSAAIAASAA